MKRGTRRALFFIAVLVFGAASYLVILVAQGYTYDFARNEFVLTGAIAVSANVDATLTVDDVPADAMSFLTHRTGADRLLPGPHTVRVTRQGYSSWHKSATVQEGLLTDFPHVMLLPIDPTSVAALKQEFIETFKNAPTSGGDIVLRGEQLWRTDTASASMIADRVLGFALTDNDDRIVWWTRSDLWVLWLRATDYQPFRRADEKVFITRLPNTPARAAWFRDHDHILVDLGAGYRIYETDLRGGSNVIKF